MHGFICFVLFSMLAAMEPIQGIEIDVDDNCFFVEPLRAIGEDAAPDRRVGRGTKRDAGGLAPVVGRSMPPKPGPKSLNSTLASMRSAAEAVDSQLELTRTVCVQLHWGRLLTSRQATAAGAPQRQQPLKELGSCRQSGQPVTAMKQLPRKFRFTGQWSVTISASRHFKCTRKSPALNTILSTSSTESQRSCGIFCCKT